MPAGHSVVDALREADVVETVRQVEVQMGEAMVAADTDKLNQIFANDWRTISAGEVVTKESFIDDFKSGKDKLISYKLTPMDIQVFGNSAVAHGGVVEKRTYDRKDRGGEFLWMDFLKKRGDDWVVTRSLGFSTK